MAPLYENFGRFTQRLTRWPLPAGQTRRSRPRLTPPPGTQPGCEPTGHRWRVLDQLAAGLGMPLVCVQPLLVGRARESEDYTRDKTDDKDAVLIARLVGDLRCYVPERAEETWARLRHLGARRERLVAAATANVQQLRDLLECAWPAVLGCAAKPFESNSWCAALTVVLHRGNGRPERLARMRFSQ
ncbi:IS110 family transposase [Amycolatopsis nalaikhensis]|uniref:Transposase n=1 Tax=Amycolatopsis nalaikhensis TaxID=715472 RepID=A0ABY8XZ65_9PSEU|nr:transposase [Amycolatopsis sp. 2-2]WIV60913.1 transposase [Amycolatopsis sp. 2-2]